MNKQPKLWEILAAFLPVLIGIAWWLWNLGTQVQRQEVRINTLESGQAEYRMDIKELNKNIGSILIKLEDKADRSNK